MTTPSLTLHQASIHYSNRLIFDNLTWHIPAGRWVALLGISGVGKSTLLRLLAGIDSPGIAGRLTLSNLQPPHTQIAYMSQTDALLPWRTTLDNVLIQQSLCPDTNDRDIRKQAVALLNKIGLGDALHTYPHQLSGGMRQRAALARTLMQNKPIILMDEPFSAVDAITRYALQNLAASLLKGKTVVLVTHDPSEALRLADDIYLLNGQPAALNAIASMETPSPRSLNNPELLHHQNTLYQALSDAQQAAVA